MIYELRTYYITPGKLEDIHNRFSKLTLGLFKRHGLHVVDFWEDAEGKAVIYYILEHKDMESREQNLSNFRNDPEWIEGKRLSELNGPIVQRAESVFMKRVPYSPVNVSTKKQSE